VRFLAENQSAPTRVEISEHFGWSSANAAQEHLLALAKKGVIALKANKSRGIFILNSEPWAMPGVKKQQQQKERQ
jgi:repressor LexA